MLARAARGAGCHRIGLFDQDSVARSELPSVSKHIFDSLVDAGVRPAVVGFGRSPRPARQESRRTTQRGPGLLRSASCAPVNYVIGYSSLVTLDAINAVRNFRVEYLIEAIEIK